MKQPHIIRFFNWVTYSTTKSGRSKKTNVNATPAELLVFAKKGIDFEGARAIIANALGIDSDAISICDVTNLVTCDDNIIQFPA
jgi:hypothetical protein